MLRRFGFLLAVALLAAVPAAAQDDRPIKISLGGGYTGIYGDGADRTGSSGGNFTAGVQFKLTPLISLQGEYGWNGIKQKQISLPVSPTPGAPGVPTDFFADANMQYGDFNVLLSPKVGGKAAPYVVTGLGVYYRPVAITTPAVGFTTICDPWWYVCYPVAVPVDRVVGSRSSTDFGMNFGGGVNFHVSERASIYVEIRYHYIWGPTIEPTAQPLAAAGPVKSNGQFMPITFGFRF